MDVHAQTVQGLIRDLMRHCGGICDCQGLDWLAFSV